MNNGNISGYCSETRLNTNILSVAELFFRHMCKGSGKIELPNFIQRYVSWTGISGVDECNILPYIFRYQLKRMCQQFLKISDPGHLRMAGNLASVFSLLIFLSTVFANASGKSHPCL